jgi:hypothetical protein
MEKIHPKAEALGFLFLRIYNIIFVDFELLIEFDKYERLSLAKHREVFFLQSRDLE